MHAPPRRFTYRSTPVLDLILPLSLYYLISTTQANEFGPFPSDGKLHVNRLSGCLSQIIGPLVGFGVDVTVTSADPKRKIMLSDLGSVAWSTTIP